MHWRYCSLALSHQYNGYNDWQQGTKQPEGLVLWELTFLNPSTVVLTFSYRRWRSEKAVSTDCKSSTAWSRSLITSDTESLEVSFSAENWNGDTFWSCRNRCHDWIWSMLGTGQCRPRKIIHYETCWCPGSCGHQVITRHHTDYIS